MTTSTRFIRYRYGYKVFHNGTHTGFVFRSAGKWTACDRYTRRLSGFLASRKDAAEFIHWCRMNGAAV